MPKLTASFAHMLPRLVTAYDQGLLVPFLGAGMSRDLCPDWGKMVRDLNRDDLDGVEASGTEPNIGVEDGGPVELIRTAHRAVQRLTLESNGRLAEKLPHTLYNEGTSVDNSSEWARGIPQSKALAALWWPLVVSTNYDDLFARLYRDERAEEAKDKSTPITPGLKDPYAGTIKVIGRDRADCAELLNALSVTAPTLLWAIHGLLPASPSEATKRLENDLVVGHDEYRRLTHAEPYYRRTFGELWRKRSFFFLGSSRKTRTCSIFFRRSRDLWHSADATLCARVTEIKHRRGALSFALRDHCCAYKRLR
jgi:hypothetical protein